MSAVEGFDTRIEGIGECYVSEGLCLTAAQDIVRQAREKGRHNVRAFSQFEPMWNARAPYRVRAFRMGDPECRHCRGSGFEKAAMSSVVRGGSPSVIVDDPCAHCSPLEMFE